MPQPRQTQIKFAIAALIVVGTIAWLAITGASRAKSYYVTIAELHAMGDNAYGPNLRVAGNVEPGSIQRNGPKARVVLVELGKTIPVDYQGSEPPPDTFKDDAQALAIGTYGRDNVFHATQLQAKCASKYAPAKPGQAPSGNTTPLKTTASLSR